jgi:hypothetical protein
MNMITASGALYIAVFLFSFNFSAISQTLDFSVSEIVCFEEEDRHILKSIEVLQEEIKKRSNILLPVSQKMPASGQPVILVGTGGQSEKFPEHFRNVIAAMPPINDEGYKIAVIRESMTVLVVGHDARGVLYGIGRLLRTMEIRNGQVLVPAGLSISSSPAYPIRGHQLGYRPKTNSYDAWTPGQFDSYIRDLAIFGANSVEIVPPRTDDLFSNNLMPLPAIEMIAEQSRICDSYGLDVWMWYPNMGSDYSHPDSITFELEERHEVFGAVERLDALFVPGGDPGYLEPDVLFNWLEKVAEVLHQYHPNARIWVSPQVFRPSQAWFDAFYNHVNNEYPWFGGVVFGPWIKTPLAEIRKTINPGIPIRRYPDITHSLSSQYPVPEWDLAYAITLGRECINPRPDDQKFIHNALALHAQGSISYSEGTNDDVNKFIWSDQDWNPETAVIETLRDYARYFIGPDYTESVAQGLLAQERNITGPLLTNKAVMNTLYQWQDMEAIASGTVMANFRFQMGLLRAYYDAYVYQRLVYETELERKALEILSVAENSGSLKAIREARATLSQAWEMPVMPALRKRCDDLADSLFRSIGAQLTVERHFAARGRGNFIDNIDFPLNNSPWLTEQLSRIEKLPGEELRLQEIKKVVRRDNPGPGGFYDNFGSPQSMGRVVINTPREEDPGSLLSPRVSFGAGIAGTEWVHVLRPVALDGQVAPISWMNQVNTLYDHPLEIIYDNLDPHGSYTIRIAYTGRFRSRMKMYANDIPVHDFIETGTLPFHEFRVPAAAVSNGKITFKWTCGEGERGSQVSEIWLIKNQAR